MLNAHRPATNVAKSGPAGFKTQDANSSGLRPPSLRAANVTFRARQLTSTDTPTSLAVGAGIKAHGLGSSSWMRFLLIRSG
jgi:hypothetical protein